MDWEINQFVVWDCLPVEEALDGWRQCFELWKRCHLVGFEPAYASLAAEACPWACVVFLPLSGGCGHGGWVFEEGVAVVGGWVAGYDYRGEEVVAEALADGWGVVDDCDVELGELVCWADSRVH